MNRLRRLLLVAGVLGVPVLLQGCVAAVGAGAAEGAIDAASILKPMLARGELQTIGATTLDEHRPDATHTRPEADVDQQHVGVRAVGGEHLGAVDAIAVAIGRGGGGEHLAAQGLQTTYVTSAGSAQAWGVMTNEQPQVHQAFRRAGIGCRTLQVVEGFDGESLALSHVFSGERQEIAARSLVIVGQREGGSPLYDALRDGGAPVVLTGDANAPGAVAHAVWQAHRAARELAAAPSAISVRRDAPFAMRDLGPGREAAE